MVNVFSDNQLAEKIKPDYYSLKSGGYGDLYPLLWNVFTESSTYVIIYLTFKVQRL